MLSRQQVGKCFYKAGYDTIYHDGIEHAGYLAYLGLLSLFPFLVFFVAFAGYFGELETGKNFINLLFTYLPSHFTSALMPRIEEIVSGPPQGLFTIAIIAVIWTASSSVEGMRTILNRAYRVETPPNYVWRRLMSILQFLVLTIAIFIAMFCLVVIPVLWHKVELWFNLDGLVSEHWQNIRLSIGFGVLALSVATSYYVLPNIKQRLIRVFPGTVLVLVGWFGAISAFTFYMERFKQLSLVYGSLEGIIVTLLFFWVVAVVYIFGAEFNYHIEKALGHTIEQKEEGEKKKRASVPLRGPQVEPQKTTSSKKSKARGRKRKSK